MQTTPFLISAAVAVVIFLAFLLLLPQRIASDEEKRKRALLGRMSEDAERLAHERGLGADVLRDRNLMLPTEGLAGAFFRIPGAQSTAELILKAGLWSKAAYFVLGVLLFFAALCFALRGLGVFGFLIAFGLAFWVPRRYLLFRIRRRNQAFLNLFPDAVDMIVRSVRSGHPLNTALQMIATNMENPIRDEFKQVVDEVSYGRPLPEALVRLSQRIGEQDLNFFVVVLSVQQETGGSLAEVLTNLSGIIRKRRQLRLKIRALTSEGRATAYVLGALPVLEFCILYYITPSYMKPLFESLAGNLILAAAAALIVCCVWVVNSMVNIEI